MSFHGTIATFQIEVSNAGDEIRDTEFSQCPDVAHAPSIALADPGGARVNHVRKKSPSARGLKLCGPSSCVSITAATLKPRAPMGRSPNGSLREGDVHRTRHPDTLMLQIATSRRDR